MILTGDRNILSGPAVAATVELSVTPNTGLYSMGTNFPNATLAPRWSDRMHQGQGNLGLADGSVQAVSSSKLREQLAQTGDSAHATTPFIQAPGSVGGGLNRFQYPLFNP